MPFHIKIKRSQIKKILGVAPDQVNKFIIEYENVKGEKLKKFKTGTQGIHILNVQKLLNVRYSTKEGNQKIDVTAKVQSFTQDYSQLGTLKTVTKHFNQFLHQYISFFCGRCEGIGHHKGVVNQYLRPMKAYRPDMLNKFFNDVEHGFFHGLMAAFMCYMVNEDGKLVQPTKELEQIYMSATLHDFLKANGVEQKEHDRQLKEVYAKLCPETYVHSDPPAKFHHKHLIIADRLELRRYPDYASWVDQRFHNLYKEMKPSTQEMLHMFYNTVRPALQYIYSHRYEPFLRHGTEVAHSSIEPVFPPSNTTYYPIKGHEKVYPVEVDQMPFSSSNKLKAGEGGNKWFNDNQEGHCSNHDGAAQWNLVKGYIAMSDFKKRGVVIDTQARDHLYAKSEISTKEWVFVYQDLDSATVTKDPRFMKAREGVNSHEYLNSLIVKELPVVSQESIFLLSQFIRMFTCRIVVLQ
jgi:hypothetical protein